MRLAIVALLISCGGFLQAAEKAVPLLERDLAVRIVTLDRPVKLFSYFNLPSIAPELASAGGRAAFLQRFFDGSMNRFWDLRLTEGNYINAGPGLYAAIDPHISQQFGNSMVEIGVPVGTRFLDLHTAVSVSSETIKALVEEGYVTRDLLSLLFVKNGSRYEFSSSSLKIMIRPELLNFRKMLQDLFLRRGIVMAEYGWDTSLAGFCRLQRYSAFVVFGSRNGDKAADPFVKTLISGLELPNLTAAESEAALQSLKFKKVLGEVKLKKSWREKANFVLSSYPDAAARNELVRQTYSCEM